MENTALLEGLLLQKENAVLLEVLLHKENTALLEVLLLHKDNALLEALLLHKEYIVTWSFAIPLQHKENTWPEVPQFCFLTRKILDLKFSNSASAHEKLVWPEVLQFCYRTMNIIVTWSSAVPLPHKEYYSDLKFHSSASSSASAQEK